MRHEYTVEPDGFHLHCPVCGGERQVDVTPYVAEALLTWDTQHRDCERAAPPPPSAG